VQLAAEEGTPATASRSASITPSNFTRRFRNGSVVSSRTVRMRSRLPRSRASFLPWLWVAICPDIVRTTSPRGRATGCPAARLPALTTCGDVVADGCGRGSSPAPSWQADSATTANSITARGRITRLTATS
jgi:hypothetical protein